MPIGTDFNYQTIPEDARRLKRFIVGNREFLTMLQRFDRWPTHIEAIGRSDKIPSDARVHGVYLDHSRQGYAIIVEHPSYPEVDPGAEIPIARDSFHQVIGLRVIDKASAIPCNLSKQALTEIFSFCVEQLEALDAFEEHETWLKEQEAKSNG